jgi:hypothetical protein
MILEGAGRLLFACPLLAGQPGIGSAIFHLGMESSTSERHAMPVTEKCGKHNSKTKVVVPVVGIVPVTVGTTNIIMIIVERAATNNSSIFEPIPLTILQVCYL